MNISAPFISRPVATTLLTIGIALSGILAFSKLPVAPLPQVDFPTISVSAQLPGASPETVATSVASPLERHLGTIADVTEMTSQSGIGQARITLQFDLNRDIDGAARDVQAAIVAARADLPASLKSNPTYRKVNPADAPILILAMTSKTLTQGQMYDAASNVFQQRLSQISGVGQVIIGGSALPAVRVELNPKALFKYGIGLEDVRAALASANANSPKGTIDDGDQRYQVYTNDQSIKAADYRPLVIAYRNGAAVALSDVATVSDSVEDVRNLGLSNGQPSVLIIVFRQPGANIISTIDSVKDILPALQAAMPADVNVTVAIDRSTTIRDSLSDTEFTLVIAISLVTLVVFVFLRNFRATVIPGIAVPISILGTFGGMYLLGYSLDILSLMALTIATGFVVDDAIVVLENISRHLEEGMPRMQAALRGAHEVGFTVLSISLSLIAVFIPILLMGGILGRLFREFTVTLSLAILISLAISLTTTPMLCALWLKPLPRAEERRRTFFDSILGGYERSLAWALRHGGLVMLVLLTAVCLNVVLIKIIPKGLFPEQDTGRLIGQLQADQSVSFQAMTQKLRQMMDIVQADPAVDHVVGYTGVGSGGGFGAINTGQVFVSLKAVTERPPVDQVIARLRPQLAKVPGGRLFLVAVQDVRAGGRQSNATYQYTLQADDANLLYTWAPKLVQALEHNEAVTDVSSDQQQKGLETDLVIDRDTASRLGITPAQIDNTLYDAFGQRQVSVIYSAINQYHVVMEIDPRYTQFPASLNDIYVATSGGGASGTATSNAPAGTVKAPAKATTASTASAIATAAASANNNSARNAAINSLATAGKSNTSAGAAVSHNARDHDPARRRRPLHTGQHAARSEPPRPVRCHNHFVQPAGRRHARRSERRDQRRHQSHPHARVDPRRPRRHRADLRTSLANEGVLIVAAIAAVYILLGMLYESYIHPITILSTLPSAGVGALLALMLFHTQFDIIGTIGVILLIGIVKKNAIMMIDFAIYAKRSQNLGSRDAIFQACLLRFRPIMMTTIGGDPRRDAAGAELRQRRRNPQAAGHRHHGRPDHQPVADALHHAGALPLHGPLRPMDAASTAAFAAWPLWCAAWCAAGRPSRMNLNE